MCSASLATGKTENEFHETGGECYATQKKL